MSDRWQKKREEIAADVRAAAKELGVSTLSRLQYCQYRKIPINRVDEVGGWLLVCKIAGIQPLAREVLSEAEIFLGVKTACLNLHGIPTTKRQLVAELSYSAGWFKKRGWNYDKILKNFSAWIDKNEPDFPYRIALLERIQSETSPRLRPNTNLSSQDRIWSKGSAAQYGNPINFRGLLHEPVNEQGVVFIFGMVARELGFVVESVQTGFPDCEGKRRVATNRWQRVLIEFEYQSRNFRDHGHDPEGCQLIICWEHNWPECPLEVLELRSELKKLSHE